jgi:hypothetical protein
MFSIWLFIALLIFVILVPIFLPVFVQTPAVPTAQIQVKVNLPQGEELSDEELEKVEGQLFL